MPVQERHYDYTVILEREEDGGCHASCPALKGCHTQGDTIEEAIANIKEAIELYLEDLKQDGEPIPDEDILIRQVRGAA
jgi:predicted RNase H-like HicB family nuclease